MRTLLLTTVSALAIALCAYLAVPAQNQDAKVKLKLIDAETGKDLGGMVRIYRADGDKPLALPGLFDRLRGLERTDTLTGWYVVPASGVETTLPRAKLKIEAVSGLETTLVRQDLDLSADAPKEVSLKLKTLFRPEQSGLVAGNTHLHLRGMTIEESDQYLRQIPAADGIKVMLISYLERHKDDESYITNRYPIGELKKFEATGVLFNNGEEHRHNFLGYGQGYGHVMFLDLKELVKPVSIGAGITGSGHDEPALTPGIESARKQEGTIIWCHNTNGFEYLPNALAGRLDALNVFDGSRTGTFEERYYRCLNIGMRLPISTGTDWFIYDFSRVYAKAPGKLSVKSWLDAVKSGRCQATNSPLLSLTVDGQDLGAVIKLDKPKTVKIEATALGRHNFQKLQLVQNGQVIQTETAENKDGGFSARLQKEVRLDGPAWFALRIEATTKNEFDRQLYAHTSPVYVDLAGERVFDVETARTLIREVEAGRAEIKAKGKFSGPQGEEKVLALYDQAVKDLTNRINQRGK